MHHPSAPSTAAITGHPIHATLVPFPIVCFTLALVTDIAYWRSADIMWQKFSEWLLIVGIVLGVLAAIAGAIDLLSRRAVRARGSAWSHAIGNVIVLVLAFLNNLVHARDGWTGVVPQGLILSVATVVVMIVTVWLGRSMVFRHGVGVRNHE